MLFLTTSCSKGEKKMAGISDQKAIFNEHSISVNNITKICDENLNKNIYELNLCLDWSLNEAEIIKIISLGEKNNSSETLNLLSNENSSWIYADIIKDKVSYKLQINPMSFYFLTDSKGNREFYTFHGNASIKVQKYFVRILSEEDDKNYEDKLDQAKNNRLKEKIDVSNWEGKYTFDNNNFNQLYKNYHLVIDSSQIYFYEGNLPGCQIYCIPYIYKNELYLYYNGSKTNCSGYDTTIIDNLQDGDLLLKLSKKNNIKYLKSPIIKYWNDSIADFTQNVSFQIELDR